MAAAGPFGADRRVAVAVSGGADSMALAVLLAGWGRPVALVVDHGLRVDSASEAAVTVRRLSALGIRADILTLHVPPGAAVAERARAARYAVLETACRAAGWVDLLLGHHARDQAETVLLRAASGSGPAGLAAMALVSEREAVRRVRPLLRVGPSRLRATLAQAGVGWVEDPGNTDPATPRGRLRAEVDAAAFEWAAAEAHQHGKARHATDAAVADELARHVTLRPDGVAFVAAPALRPESLSALIWTLSGRAHPPPPASVARLATLRPVTVHGVVILPGRGGWWMGREAACLSPPQPARHGNHWDGRFGCGAMEGTIGALGSDAARLRRWSDLPARLLQTVPAIRRNDALFAVPHLSYPDRQTCRGVPIAFRPSRPAAPRPFVVA